MVCKDCGKILKESKTGFCRNCYPKQKEAKIKNSLGLKQAYRTGKKVNIFSEEDRNKAKQIKKQQKDKYIYSFVNQHGYFPIKENNSIKKYLIELFNWERKCNKCNLSNWLEQDIPLELDHIDGDNKNTYINNLRFLCPNCHSLTDTYRGKNINSGKQKVDDKDFILALKEKENISQALYSLGLTPKGGNYKRAYKLLESIKNTLDKDVIL